MINSMTGFGRGNAGRGKNRIDVEIRAINSRYLDTKFRGIQLDFQLEQEIKKIIEKEIQRGRVLIHVDLANDLDSQKYTFDKDRFESLKDIIKSVYVLYGQRLSLSDVVTTNDLLKTEKTPLINSEVAIKANTNKVIISPHSFIYGVPFHILSTKPHQKKKISEYILGKKHEWFGLKYQIIIVQFLIKLSC